MSTSMLSSWIESHEQRAPLMHGLPAFYRNIEERLDTRRANHSFWGDTWKDRDALDFSSNDTLSLGAGGLLRDKFIEEISQTRTDNFASGGARSLPDGRYAYLEQVEQEIAKFHGAECGIIVGSGYEANVALFTSIPQSGDVIVYDEMIHASVHDGMRKCRAETIAFRHNNVEHFREILLSAYIRPEIRDKSKSIIVAVESLYSMEGDICPLKELVEVAKGIADNVFFFIDEAHSTGVVGPRGAGLVNFLSLEEEVAVRVHTCGKALAANGAIVLGKKTIRDAIITLARPIFFSTAPSLPFVALIRSGYALLRSGQTDSRRNHIQSLVCMFFDLVNSNDVLQKAIQMGILSIPLAEGYLQRSIITPIVPVQTRPGYHYWLFTHLALSKICAFAVQYPTVPREHPRVRLVFRASHSRADVEYLSTVICAWTEEIISLEEQKDGQERLPRSARLLRGLTPKHIKL